MEIIKALSRFLDRALGVLHAISGVILIGMMLSIGASVVSRYFFKIPFGWAQEVSEYSVVVLTFLSLAWVLKLEGHVSMDLLISRLKPKPLALLNAVTSAICVVVCFTLTYYAIKVAMHEYADGYTTYTFLAPPKYIFTLVIMFGMFVFGLQFVRRSFGFITTFQSIGKDQQ